MIFYSGYGSQNISAFIPQVIVSFIWMNYSFPTIHQQEHYHDFADKRKIFGIPNFLDVISNLFFIYVAFFASTWHYSLALILVGVGSGWYHLWPTSDSLFFDRMPMTFAFMSLWGDKINSVYGTDISIWLFWMIGAFSILWWKHSGSLNFYAWVQFYPMINFLTWAHNIYELEFLAWYLLAKVTEYFDEGIYKLSRGLVSGHTLKHILCAYSAYLSLNLKSKS